MIGRTPGHIQAVRPLKDGVIADFDICEKMLRYFIQKVHQRRWAKPRMVIACRRASPASSSARCKRPPSSPARASPPTSSKSRWPRRSAPDLPVQEPTGNMIVDIGGGTTEVAVISLGGVVAAQSARIGGDELDDAIMQYIKKEYSLALGERTAEEIKIAARVGLAAASKSCTPRSADETSSPGCPRPSCARRGEIREAMAEPIAAIVRRGEDDARQDTARARGRHHGARHHAGRRRCPADGLDARLHHETGMPINIAPNPLYSVVLGVGQSLEEFEALKDVLFSSSSE